MNRRYQRLYLSRVSPFKSKQYKSTQLNTTQHKSNQIKSNQLGGNQSTRRKTSRSRVENQQTQPTYDAESGNRTRATLVQGECSTTVPTLLPQSVWSKQCDGCSLAHEIPAADVGRFQNCISRKLLGC